MKIVIVIDGGCLREIRSNEPLEADIVLVDKMIVVVEVNGGLVQAVRSDTPDIEVIVVDWDVIDVSDPAFGQKIASQVLNAEGDVDEERFPHVLY